MPLKKMYLLLSFILICFSAQLHGQIICIKCYPQEETISPSATNLLSNGGFENIVSVSGGNVICPNSSQYNADVTDWTCSDGGTGTYANSNTGSMLFKVVEGTRSVYLGNSFCNLCSNMADDTSCLSTMDCEMVGIPPGFPQHTAAYGGSAGVSLSQTVSNLVVGDEYILEFWSGGEGGVSTGIFLQDGLFGVDLGFGYTYFKCNPSGGIGTMNAGETGLRYLIQFRATQTSHEVKFTNWGHICSSCTEVILDDASLYKLAELNSDYDPCGGSGGNPGGTVVNNYSFDSTLCTGDTYSFNGSDYFQTGFYIDSIRQEDTLSIYGLSLIFEDCYIFVVPNAFTPNGDVNNDKFVPVKHNFSPQTYKMNVFNRYGQIVFSTNDFTEGWDGRFKGVDCDLGTYVYTISFKLNANSGEVQKRGDVILLR